LDITGKECALTNGVASRAYVYDGAVCTVQMYLDISGRLVCAANGWARSVSRFDTWLNYVNCVFYDENGCRILTDEDFAECRHKYDESGNLVEHMFHGVDGKPCLHKGGYAGWQTNFDEKGREIRNVWIGCDGRPLLVDGFAEYRCSYDEHGLMISKRFYDIEGAPCCRLGKDAGWNAEWDEQGREIRNVWIGINGERCLVNGYCEYRCSYDANGHMTSVRYYGVDGSPCLRNHSDSGWNAEYDNHGRLVRKIWLGVKGEPHCRKGGYAECRYKYDANGNQINIGYYSIDGRLCSDNGGESDSDWESSERR